YLEQDLIRQFVEAATTEERFASVSELVGAGRVTELQTGLEQAKRAWSAVTNQRQDELSSLRERLAAIDARLAETTSRLPQESLPVAAQEWSDWWQRLSSVGIKAAQVEPGSREAPVAIDGIIKQLDAVRRSTERRLQTLSALTNEVAGLTSRRPPDLEAPRAAVATLREE